MNERSIFLIFFFFLLSSFFLGGVTSDVLKAIKLKVESSQLTISVLRHLVDFVELLQAKFSGGENFPVAKIIAKIQNSGHDGAKKDANGGYESSVHQDQSSADRLAFDNGELVEVGPADGARGAWGFIARGFEKDLAYYKQRLERRANESTFNNARIPLVEHTEPSQMERNLDMYIWRETWVWLMNGIIRHNKRQNDEKIQVYHQGRGTGPCFNMLVTFTRDLTGPEAKWVMTEGMKCLNRIESLFQNL